MFLDFDREKQFSPMKKIERSRCLAEHTQEGEKHDPSWNKKVLNPAVTSMENCHWRSLEPAHLNSWQDFIMHLGFYLRIRRESMAIFKGVPDRTVCIRCSHLTRDWGYNRTEGHID